MKAIETNILINASKEQVWDVLMNFQSYPKWNTFFKSIEGEAKTGNKLINRIYTKNGSYFTFKPKVLEVTEYKTFRWIGWFLFPGLFDGEHQFILKETLNGYVEFIHREEFSGVLLPILWKKLLRDTLPGFVRFNNELKKSIESVMK